MAQVIDFEKTYKEYWEKVYRLCMAYVNDDMLARDLAQEAFIIVWENLSKFRGDSTIATWIFKITTNHCLRQVEKRARFKKVEIPIQLQEETPQDITHEVELLYEFISELPEIDRIIISLELEEVKQSEIATIAGLSEGNIRVRIHRIKERLTQRFKENGY